MGLGLGVWRYCEASAALFSARAWRGGGRACNGGRIGDGEWVTEVTLSVEVTALLGIAGTASRCGRDTVGWRKEEAVVEARQGMVVGEEGGH